MPPLPTVKKLGIVDYLKKKGITENPHESRKGTLWKGPQKEGITYSLLTRFLSDRERFRLLTVEGLKAGSVFDHKRDYGSMWHICEEQWAKECGGKWYGADGECMARVRLKLEEYCRQLAKEYRGQTEQIRHWGEICKIQFPLYVDYWAKHPDVKKRTPICQERPFDIPYRLPSNRVVILKGKFDSIDLVEEDTGLYLQENKTKSDIRREKIERQLRFDLQTMFYFIAMKEYGVDFFTRRKDVRFKGVRYNVVRRPLSGGKGTIKMHKATKKKKAETHEHFYGRVRDIIEDAPDTYFQRWKVTISEEDVRQFKEKCLNPILEQLCTWWDWITYCLEVNQSPFTVNANTDRPHMGLGLHWLHPFGSTNWIDEGYYTDLDDYILGGSMVGLHRVDELFPELK